MYFVMCRSGWPGGLRCRSSASRLQGMQVRISPRGMHVSCKCCVLSGIGFCDGPIPHTEESYQVCVVSKCQQWDGLAPSGSVGCRGGAGKCISQVHASPFCVVSHPILREFTTNTNQLLPSWQCTCL